MSDRNESQGCPYCGSEVVDRRRTFCSRSCSVRVRSARFRGIVCAAPECERASVSLGYCAKHYKRVKRYGDLRVAAWVEMTESERFWSKVSTGSDDVCWEWQGELNNKGYGVFRTWRSGGKQKHLAHRYALNDKGREIEGKVAMHSCDNPPCCNPNHLSLGTQLDNIRDARKKGRLDLTGLEQGWQRSGVGENERQRLRRRTA